MIRGIGVDTVDIEELGALCAGPAGDAFVRLTFTEAERDDAKWTPEAAKTMTDHQLLNLAERLAVRFAVKEAVFKAVAHLLPEKTFDFRIVETRHHPDGCPYVTIDPEVPGGAALHPILDRAEVDSLFVSATTEAGVATAFVVATCAD